MDFSFTVLFQSMAGGVMGQVQGLIPGMKREEDVPDPAPPAEGEYQEYAVNIKLKFQDLIFKNIKILKNNMF